MAYEAQCEARDLAIEKEEERFKTIDEANDELCQHIDKMSIKTEKNLKQYCQLIKTNFFY